GGRAGGKAYRLPWRVIPPFLRAVPNALRHLSPGRGTCLHIQVTGPGGGSWMVQRRDAVWVVGRGWPARPADALVRLSSDALWRGGGPGEPRGSARGAGRRSPGPPPPAAGRRPRGPPSA